MEISSESLGDPLSFRVVGQEESLGQLQHQTFVGYKIPCHLQWKGVIGKSCSVEAGLEEV
jgi:hypothetical protein